MGPLLMKSQTKGRSLLFTNVHERWFQGPLPSPDVRQRPHVSILLAVSLAVTIGRHTDAYPPPQRRGANQERAKSTRECILKRVDAFRAGSRPD